MKTSWDYKLLFENLSKDELDKEKEKVIKANEAFATKWKKNQRYLEDPKILKTALDELELLQKDFGQSGKGGYYYWLQSQVDETNSQIKAAKQQYDDLGTKLANELRFFELSLAKISVESQKKFLADKSLEVYHHFLKRLFDQAKYTLTEKEENVISLLSHSAFSAWEEMVSGFLSKQEREVIIGGKKQRKNFSELLSLLSDKNKKVRDAAAVAFNDILDSQKEVAEAEINAILHFKKVDDELRGFIRPDSSRFLADDVDEQMVDTLLETVANRYDIAQRFYTLKASLLGVKKMSYHERNVEIESAQGEYLFKNGEALVRKVFHQLDPLFETYLEEFLKSGQIDVFPKKGKRSGAFCVYWLKTAPTYVLTNYTDTLRDVTTLAHEMGHAINNELLRTKQHALYFGTPTSTAEVASTFMEDFVLEELMKTASDQERLSLLMTKLNEDISAIFRQVACFRFEQELHKMYREKGYLSYQEIGQIFQKHMKDYMGPSVEQSSGSENWWIYWNHIRMFFYVYSYAGGLLISKAMQHGVRKNHNFIEKVKEFLSAGLSESPRDIFLKMDIDITKKAFWNAGLDEIEKLLTETEALVKKLKKA
jgi:oligoendopeptidase F